MKKSVAFFLFAILGIVTVSCAQKQGIIFENGSVDKALVEIYKEPNLDKIFEKAKQDGKIVFIDCLTSWCGPCKSMAKNVFTDDTVGDICNSYCVCIKLDMEKGKGPEFAKRYEIKCYPTIITLDENSKLLHRMSGLCSVQEFIQFIKTALDPEKRYSFFKDKYDSGNISRQELISLMRLRKYSCLDVDKETETYFKNFESDNEHAALDWSVIRDFGINIHSPVFKFLITNKEVFYSVYTEDSVNQVIENLYRNEIQKCFSGMIIDSLGYEKLRSEVLNSNLPFSGKLICESELSCYERTKNWKKFANSAIVYVDKYLPKDNQEYFALNQLAWAFYEQIDAGIYLDIAIGWAKRSIELHEDYFNLDTYASLLYKRGKKAEAQTMAEKAIMLEKQLKHDPPETEELLKEIKKMK